MRDIVKEAQAIIDEFILASAETTKRVQMEQQKLRRKRRMRTVCLCGAFALAGGILCLLRLS